MALDQLAEGGGIAAPHLLDQLAVGHLALSSTRMSKGHTLYRRPDGRALLGSCVESAQSPQIAVRGSWCSSSEVLVAGFRVRGLRERIMNRSRRGTENPEPAPRTQQPGTENRGLRWRAARHRRSPARSCTPTACPRRSSSTIRLRSSTNPAIRSLSGAWSQPRNTPLAGRPVAGLTFALNFAANEVDAAAYRATNISMHIACALLLFGLVRRTLGPFTSRTRASEAPHPIWPSPSRFSGSCIR